MKQINTLRGQHAKILTLKAGGTYTNQCILSCMYGKMLNLICFTVFVSLFGKSGAVYSVTVFIVRLSS